MSRLRPTTLSSQNFGLLTLLLPTSVFPSFPALKLPPAPDPLLPTLFPLDFMLPPPLPRFDLLIHLPLFPPLLLHLRFQLLPSPVLIIDQYLHRLLPPLALEFFTHAFHFFRVRSQFEFAHEEHAGVGDAFVEAGASFLVGKFRLGFFEPVKGIGGAGVRGFVRVDEEGFFAVRVLYVGEWDAGLEVEDCVAAEIRGRY